MIVLIMAVFFLKTFCVQMYLVQQPDPNQPKPEGAQMLAMRGEQLGVVTNWPPSLEAALQRWGTISPKAPCLTTMDTNGKPLYILTYGNPLRLIHLLSACACTQLPLSGWQFIFVLAYVSNMEINGTQKEILDWPKSSFAFSCKILLKIQMNFGLRQYRKII